MKNILLLIFLLTFSVLCFSQTTEGQMKPKFTPLIKPNTISITGTFENELILIYERLIGRTTAIEIGFGKKWIGQTDNKLSKDPTTNHSSTLMNDYIDIYSGYLGTVSFKKYLAVPKHPLYLSLGLTYKNYSYNNINVHYSDDDYFWNGGYTNYCEIISGKKEVLAAKLLFGEKFNFKINADVNFVMDVYAGVGFRGKFFQDEILAQGETTSINYNDCNCTPLADPIHRNSTVYTPSVQLGLKVGVGF